MTVVTDEKIGPFQVVCMCGWSFTGPGDQVRREVNAHDDFPRNDHIVELIATP